MAPFDLEPFPYDRVVKDMFFHDRPRFLERITGGKPIRGIASSELPKTLERRADMVLIVDPGELHHIEFQSHNFAGLPYRQGVDCFLLAERHRKRRIVQTVIYFGDRPLRMVSALDTGAGQVRYRLIDIREYTASEIAEGGGAADLVLATLARGGRKNFKSLLERIYELPQAARNRALAQTALLAGLRRMTGVFTMEMNRMGWQREIQKNEFLRDYFEAAMAEGVAKGAVSAARASLRTVLEARYGTLPAWVEERIERGSIDEVTQWTRKSVTARSMESLFRQR